MTSKKLSQSVNHIAERYASIEWLRPMLQLIPFGVGSAIDSLFGNRAARIQMDRIRHLLDGVKYRIERLNEKKIDKNFLKSDEFYFFCREIFQSSTNERSQKKIEFFTNIFVHGLLKTRKELDVTSLYLEILSELFEAEILLLSHISHLCFDEATKYLTVERLLTLDLGLKSTAPNSRFLDHLEQHQLIELTEAYDSDLEADSYSLTEFGKEFIEVISDIGKKFSQSTVEPDN